MIASGAADSEEAPADCSLAASGDGDVEGLRNEAWETLGQKRRAVLNVHALRKGDKQGEHDAAYKAGGTLTQILRKSSAAKFEGKLNEKHLGILLSADLLGFEPSLTETPAGLPATSKELELAAKWLLANRGPAAYLIAFDGRSRPCRR